MVFQQTFQPGMSKASHLIYYREDKMDDIDRKAESWIRKLPKIIIFLAVLIFIIIVIRDYNQSEKWKEDQGDLTAKIKQTSEELAILREANGSLDDVRKKIESLKQRADGLNAELDKLTHEKNTTDVTLAKLRQELNELNGQVSAGRNKVAELTEKHETLKTTNQQLRNDIVNKKSVLESIVFLQRQKPILEQNIQDLKVSYELAANEEAAQQNRLEVLQKKIQAGETDIQAQNERLNALNGELTKLAEAVKTLSQQKERLELWDDSQKKLEYLDYLQQQKESLEMSINNLLERGKKLEQENSKLQQNTPVH